jgi:hypothetical protein
VYSSRSSLSSTVSSTASIEERLPWTDPRFHSRKLEKITIRALVKIERMVHASVRRQTFAQRCAFAAVLTILSVFIVCLPLVLSQATSFDGANSICQERSDPVFLGLSELKQRLFGPLTSSHREASTAGISASLFVSLLGELYWLFSSPYSEERAPSSRRRSKSSCSRVDTQSRKSASSEAPTLDRTLDRTLGSFFMLQLLSSMCVAAAMHMSMCTQYHVVHEMAVFFYMVAMFGGSIIGTNILSHRCLLCKARAMMAVKRRPCQEGDRRRGPRLNISMKQLVFLFNVEFRALVVVFPTIILFMIEGQEIAAYIFGMVIMVPVMLADAIVSVMLTAIFLRPILDTLRMVGETSVGTQQRSNSARMRRAKQRVLIGCFIAVASSTLLYLNLLCFFGTLATKSYFVVESQGLNPQIFGANLDVILNCVGVILAC